MKPLKYQRQIDCLEVYCSKNERGCDCLGLLSQLDDHLDPDKNNYQHIDTKYPLSCQLTIPKNMVEHHVNLECVKRDFVCQYCNLKATYEVIVDTHWPVYIYLSLQCPNFCGVTCERDVIEDHMRTCRLAEVACVFSGVGCDVKFRQEDQEVHARQNNQKHLTMIAAAAVKMNQQLQQKLQEQDEKLQEQDEKLREQEEKQQEQDEKLQEQDERFHEENQKNEKELQQQKLKFDCFEDKFEEQQQKFHRLLQEQDKKFVELQKKSNHNEVVIKEVTNFISLERTFAMENFSNEKEKDKPSDWRSPAMHTHMLGYKFCIGIAANGGGNARGKAVTVYLYAMQGEYDHQLKWPAQASFTIELLNQHGGENIIHTSSNERWYKPKKPYHWICTFAPKSYAMYSAFLEHSKLKDFLVNDAIHFHISNIQVM